MKTHTLILPLMAFLAMSCGKKPQERTSVTIDQWQFKQAGNQKNIAVNWLPANVPGCVHTDLLNNNLIPDPFYRTNEKQLQWIDKTDWEYQSIFKVGKPTLERENIELVFKGLDTYADVYVNDSLLISADNMFREWSADCKKFLKEGDNTLRVHFHSPIQKGLKALDSLGYALPANNDQSENGELGNKKVSVFTRKAGYHYGWDWGPRFVTSGIWRPVCLQAWDGAKINFLQINQKETSKEAAKITATFEVKATASQKATFNIYDEKANQKLGSVEASLKAGINMVNVDFTIANPKLWWSHGLGDPYLYLLKGELVVDGKTIDAKTEKTGIRTLKLIQKPDSAGKSFYFELNGVPVFAKGANYIPNDNFLNRVTPERYKQVIMDAVNANMNMLRVWGGGVYENDVFYDLCDENGIMLWHDFMFACSMYPGGEAFFNNIKEEAVYNVKRLRNHPSIALWCGNNEMDAAWSQYVENWGWGWKQQFTPEQRTKIWADYEKIFHEILPTAVKENDTRFYWPSSPLSVWSNDSTQHAGTSGKSGDTHYWEVWHAKKPFVEFKAKTSRFMSEYGFQSFPEFETVKKYTLPEDWNIESEVMAAHQRSGIGNLRIKEYMSWDYKLPKNFENFLYLGQVLQAEGMKVAFEAHRRRMPYCMGSLYWQINDCWPVASWSSTDYYGKWKAQHYFAKKSFSEVLVSPTEDNGITSVFVVSDRLSAFDGQLVVAVLDFNGKELFKKELSIKVAANTSQSHFAIETADLLKGIDKKKCVLVTRLLENSKVVSQNVLYFLPPKDLSFSKPAIQKAVVKSGNGYSITLSSTVLAKNVMLSLPDTDGFFSDNYFDILPNEPVVVKFTSQQKIAEFEKNLKVISLVDTY